MDLGSVFLILALLILVGLYVSRPFFERRVVASDLAKMQQDHELSTLLAERDRVLNALQELDFDHALGKIPQEDYPVQRKFLLQKGADVFRKLDVLQAGQQDQAVEARLDAAIAAHRVDMQGIAASVEPGGQAHSREDDELEVMLANRRRVRREKAAGFCPKCGGPVQKSDLFCPKCGAKMA